MKAGLGAIVAGLAAAGIAALLLRPGGGEGEASPARQGGVVTTTMVSTVTVTVTERLPPAAPLKSEWGVAWTTWANGLRSAIDDVQKFSLSSNPDDGARLISPFLTCDTEREQLPSLPIRLAAASERVCSVLGEAANVAEVILQGDDSAVPAFEQKLAEGRGAVEQANLVAQAAR